MATGSPSSQLLILPGDPEFDEVLGQTLTPGWKDYAARNNEVYFVADEAGLLRPVNARELDEYLEGGEYDQRLEQIGDTEDNGIVFDDEAGLIYAFE